MHKYPYKGVERSVSELSELSGITPHTIRDRLRRGYSVLQAISPNPVDPGLADFADNSDWQDWLDLPTRAVYEFYAEWAVKNDYDPITIQKFTRQLCQLAPIKIIPIKHGDGKYDRMIRNKNWEV